MTRRVLVTASAKRLLDLTENRILLAVDCVLRVQQYDFHASSPRWIAV